MVVSDYAEDSFVVVGRVLREELDDNPSLGMWLDRSFGLAEREDVGLVREELERCGLTAVVADVQQSVGRWLDLNFTKMDRLGAQQNIHS